MATCFILRFSFLFVRIGLVVQSRLRRTIRQTPFASFFISTFLIITVCFARSAHAAFTLKSAAVTPNSISAGKTESVKVAISSSKAAVGMIVDLEIYNSSNVKVGNLHFFSQNFSAGQTRSYSWPYLAPPNLAAGVYSLSVGVFTAGWASNPLWRSRVASFSVVAAILPSTNGVCGSANGVAVTSAPSTNLCSVGTASSVSGTGPFDWSCAGVNGGSTSFCSAPLQPARSVTPNASRLCPTQTTVLNETYHEPVTRNLPSGVSFLSDWVAQPNAGGFKGIQAMDSCRMDADGFLTSHGKFSVRVEVNPGDDPIGAGTDRSEVLTMQDQNGISINDSASSGTQFYALSYYFPTNWDGTQIAGNGDSWSVVMQLYGWGALWAARTSATGTQHYWLSLGGTTFNFSDGGLISKGKWTDFVFEINYSTGAIRVYRREENQAKFIQVVNGTTSRPSSPIYFKQGLYRGPDVNGRTDVLWMGPTARGTSFTAVEHAAFGTNDGF